MRTELFGPVLALYVYDESQWTDTLRLVNSTSDYALTGSVFARDRYVSGVAVVVCHGGSDCLRAAWRWRRPCASLKTRLVTFTSTTSPRARLWYVTIRFTLSVASLPRCRVSSRSVVLV
jgi:hypothetical protein